ncbi:MAG TPA: hypothetical protein VEA58_06450 [Anaerovoracaceae bacterium]|nr:hypothetical protein [Anaerovoracaceae bacterium]
MLIKNQVEDCITPVQMNLILNSRVFWRELAVWTRVYFRSRYFGIGDADEAFMHLYDTPYKFISTLQLIFGSEFSRGYTLLLNQHIITLRELISAHIDGNVAAINQNIDLLYQNSHERASYLSASNPFWSETEWRNLFDTYIQLTLEEANSVAMDDQRQSIQIYDRISSHSDRIGDYFSQGLFDYIVYNPQINNPQNQRYRNDIPCITNTQMNTIYNMRMFWFELTAWIRALFVVIFEDIGAQENVLSRMNTVIYNYQKTLSTFLGEQPTEEYINLVITYIELFIALFNAQKEGNTEAIDQYTKSIYQNISQQAAFLASVNPYFEQNLWSNMLTNFTRYTLDSATSYLAGDISTSLDNFDRLLDLSLELGDVFAYSLFLLNHNEVL